LIGADEFAALAEDGAHLFLDAHAAENSIQSLAAGDKIVGMIRSTGGRWNQMFHTRLIRWNGALQKKQQRPCRNIMR
jgi:hypothetical protein